MQKTMQNNAKNRHNMQNIWPKMCKKYAKIKTRYAKHAKQICKTNMANKYAKICKKHAVYVGSIPCIYIKICTACFPDVKE